MAAAPGTDSAHGCIDTIKAASPGRGAGVNRAAATSTPSLAIDALRRLLQRPGGPPVRCLQTHVSWVLLDGEYAWKLKKPVRLGFLDFTGLDARRQACEDELRLNRRLAPQLYLDVVPLRGRPSAPRVGGRGPVFEHALRMRQFPDDALLGRRLAAGNLDGATIDRLGARLAEFHLQAPRADAATGYGSPRAIVQATARVLDELRVRGGDPRLDAVAGWCAAEGRSLRRVFAARQRDGWVREGHGDLHLDNLIALGDEVTAFDCIEFDPALRWIDVQSDIAFVVMDLHAHGRADLAWRFLDRWLEGSGDFGGLAVLRYYAVYRALVRALVASLRRAEGLPAPGPDYLASAEALSRASDARLLLTHGPSGSGKSLVAQRLLEVAGAVRLRSDVERKRLYGLGALASTHALGASAYSAAATRRTYARLRRAAGAALRAGCRVIVDAAFLDARERRGFADLADRLGVPLTILDCHAEVALLQARVAARLRRADDASEADCEVLERQLRRPQALRPDEQDLRIEVDTGAAIDVAAIAARWLAARRAGPR